MPKYNFRLVLRIPIIILTWHWAWVVHYPKGLMYRKKFLSGDESYIRKFSRMYYKKVTCIFILKWKEVVLGEVFVQVEVIVLAAPLVLLLLVEVARDS